MVAALGAVAALAAVAVLGVVAARAGTGAGAPVTTLSLSVGAPHGRPIASNFLGLALEYRSIPGFVGSASAVNPILVQLIRDLVPTGHPVIRIGGQSTDRTWWPVPHTSRPVGVTYDLTPHLAASIRALAQATDARLILGIELEANSPRISSYEARKLVSSIGGQYIDALEIGNEPELYSLVPWYRELHGVATPWYGKDGSPVYARPRGYQPSTFDSEFARVLGELGRVPAAGPSAGTIPWLDAFQRFLSPRSEVKLVTWHAYGLNQCVTNPSSPAYPTVPNLLALTASRNLVTGVGPTLALAHRVGASFRVDEMGSVTCNGRPGVSNTFASALWAMDSMFDIAAQGIDGVNMHTFQGSANGLFDFRRVDGKWQAAVHPLYYGVLMFAQAAPAGSRLLRIASGPQGKLRAWATLAPDHRIRVLLINDSLSDSITTHVRVPAAAGTASLERLTARSAYATSGVTLGGQSFGSETTTGVLTAPQPASVAVRGGAYTVTLPAASAALLTLTSRG